MSSTKGIALPSAMGGSLASISMMALSTPMPARAEMTCSTVCTLTPPSAMVVARSTFCTFLDQGRDEGLVLQVDAAEFEAEVLRRGLQGERDLLAGVQRGARHGDGFGESVLTVGGHRRGGRRVR
jgi:hypothetical protein